MPPSSQTILILHNDPDFTETLHLELGHLGLRTERVLNFAQIVYAVKNCAVVAIIISWPGLAMSVESILSFVVGKFPHIPAIVITAENAVEPAGGWIKQGVFDVIMKPYDMKRIMLSVHKALQFSDLLRQNRQLENFLLGGELTHPELFEDIITRNPMMLGIFKIVETIGLTTDPVLITGEPGVGKKLIASAIHRVAGTTSMARIVTASSVNFEEKLVCGAFRRDLYHFLSTHHIHIPPLRERREDIPLLMQRFMERAAAELKKRPPEITEEAMSKLQTHDYPDNVRELKSLIDKAVASDSTGLITLNNFPDI